MFAKLTATFGRRIVSWIAVAIAAELARRLVDRVLPDPSSTSSKDQAEGAS